MPQNVLLHHSLPMYLNFYLYVYVCATAIRFLEWHCVYISYDENEGKEREIVIENEVLCKHSRHNITPKNQL